MWPLQGYNISRVLQALSPIHQGQAWFATNYPGPGALRGGKGGAQFPKMSQALSATQCICFRKSSGSNSGGGQICFLPRAPSNLVTPGPDLAR